MVKCHLYKVKCWFLSVHQDLLVRVESNSRILVASKMRSRKDNSVLQALTQGLMRTVDLHLSKALLFLVRVVINSQILIHPK